MRSSWPPRHMRQLITQLSYALTRHIIPHAALAHTDEHGERRLWPKGLDEVGIGFKTLLLPHESLREGEVDVETRHLRREERGDDQCYNNKSFHYWHLPRNVIMSYKHQKEVSMIIKRIVLATCAASLLIAAAFGCSLLPDQTNQSPSEQALQTTSR